MKETLSHRKIQDSIIEIEVALSRLKENLNTEHKVDDMFVELEQMRKSLDKLRIYVVRLPPGESDV